MLGMKRQRSEKKGKVYSQTMLKKRKTGKYSVQEGAGTGAQEMKERDVVGERDPVASYSLSKDGSTSMRKLVKAMARLSSIHDVVLRSLAEEYDLGAREHLRGKVDFALTVPPYNV